MFFDIVDGANDVAIYTSDGGSRTLIADTSGPIEQFNGSPTINNSGTVAFSAVSVHSDGSRHEAIYTGNGGPLKLIAETGAPGETFSPGIPAINNQGAVAFWATIALPGGPVSEGIFVGDGGPLSVIAHNRQGAYVEFGSGIGSPSINDNGTVAFLARRTDQLRCIATGPNPETDAVVCTRDIIDGREANVNVIHTHGLNNNGQVAFMTGIFDQALYLASPRSQIGIDIKPGEGPNSVNPSSRQKIAVAVLTTNTFDALQVDPSTVEFGPDGATEFHRKTHVEDVDDDGDADLLFHFNTPDTGLKCGDAEATLRGETFNGELIVGTDSIRTVSCP